MTLTSNFWISLNRKGEVWTNLAGQTEMISDEPYRTQVLSLYRLYKKKYIDESIKLANLQRIRKNLLARTNETISEEDELEKAITEQKKRQTVVENIQRLMNFFTEFSFSPNFRFINTFSKQCSSAGYDTAKAYIANYFALTDNGYQNSIVEKMDSLEFKNICNEFSKIQTQKTINSRFKLYYGSQGTGKTTLAMEEANNNCTVCHSAMLPSDLMEDFSFDDGKAAFKPSQLYKAMLNGEKIVLDEINLLPFESLRFLQSILDGKESFVYKGQTVKIADGFQIIGTMNLQVNGMTYALPEPLVDRAADLKEFKLTADNLVGAIL